MSQRTFNLITEPWIKVIEMTTNQERMVSLRELFQNAQDYRQLAGDMRTQDLAILRLLLAILTTVYSRFDADGNLYSWLEKGADGSQPLKINRDKFSKSQSETDLLSTWKSLYREGYFSNTVVNYLDMYADRFDFFGDRPFYQVTAQDYDSLVDDNRKIATGNGKVAVKQINRRISESNNSRAIFSPKRGDAFKNEVSLEELVRWIITYQSFTGTTDKSKIKSKKKFSNSGWVYNINPVFAKGETLFETLMLNLVLVDARESVMHALQRPVWEYESVPAYVEQRRGQVLPDNLAELYTTWSRIIHIDWQENDTPTIFSAVIPIFSSDNAFIEPMTTWRQKKDNYEPDVKKLGRIDETMWRNFGQYVNVNSDSDDLEPGIVSWLHFLEDEGLIPDEKMLILNNVALIKDKNPASQMPSFEMLDDMELQADVLFDTTVAENWPAKIEATIEITKRVGSAYFSFARDIGTIRRLSDARAFGNQMTAHFYDRLNEPFREWLESLRGKDSEATRLDKIAQWKDTLRKIVYEMVDEVMQSRAPKDVTGILVSSGGKSHDPKLLNIFIARIYLMGKLKKIFDD